MGSGYFFHCDACGRTQEAFVGAGMAFPEVCREVLAEVRAGKFGQELKAAAEGEPYAGVSAEQRIYVCGECGFWEVLTDASVYGLADAEEGPGIKFGDKTVAEWGEIPYVATWADGGRFRLAAEYVPECKRCGGSMHAAPGGEGSIGRLRLRCNACGHPLSTGGLRACWD